MALTYKNNYYRYKHYFLRAKKLYRQPMTRTSLSLILTLLTISFFSLFALKPTFLIIAKLIKELRDMKKVDQTLSQKVNNLKQAQNNYNKIKNDIVYLDHSLPKKPNFNQFNQQISLLAFKHNLIISHSSFSEFELIPTSVSKEQPVLKFKITVAGDFSNIKKFLNDLENLDRLITINRTLFSLKTNIPNAQMKCEINAKTFFLTNLNKK